MCAKLFLIIICSFLNDSHRISTVAIVQKEFLVKYYSIAFAILPSIAGGLALELTPLCDLKEAPEIVEKLQKLIKHFQGEG